MFQGSKIPDPDLEWLNSRPANLSEGNYVLDFWSYSCSGCRQRSRRVQEIRESSEDLDAVGIHTPELGFERRKQNVSRAVERLGIGYPVAHSSEASLRKSFGSLCGVSQVLVVDGEIRWKAGNLEELGRGIEQLLGREMELSSQDTREILVGFDARPLNGRGFRGEEELERSLKAEIAASGVWKQYSKGVEAVRDSRMFLRPEEGLEAVLDPGDSVKDVEVFVNGRPVEKHEAGRDLRVEEGRSYLRAKFPESYRLLKQVPGKAEVQLVPERATKIFSVTV